MKLQPDDSESPTNHGSVEDKYLLSDSGEDQKMWIFSMRTEGKKKGDLSELSTVGILSA